MKATLLDLIDVYVNLNKAFDNQLIEAEELLDIKESMSIYFDKEYKQLQYGIDTIQQLDLSQLKTPKDEEYMKGMVDIYISLTNLETYFTDIRESHIKIVKTFNYITGVITKEDYESSGILEVEYDEDFDDDNSLGT